MKNQLGDFINSGAFGKSFTWADVQIDFNDKYILLRIGNVGKYEIPYVAEEKESK